MEHKKVLMNKLLNLYEQRQFVKPKCSKIIIDEYIRKLEIELGVLLNNGKEKRN